MSKSISTKITVSLLRLGAFLTREGNRLLVDTGLNQQQYVVLNHIYHQKQINQTEICSRLLFEKSNVSKIVKKLVGLELVESTRDAADSRITLLKTTKKGKQLIKGCNILFDLWNEQWLKQMSEEEQDQALKVLEELNQMVG